MAFRRRFSTIFCSLSCAPPSCSRHVRIDRHRGQAERGQVGVVQPHRRAAHRHCAQPAGCDARSRERRGRMARAPIHARGYRRHRLGARGEDPEPDRAGCNRAGADRPGRRPRHHSFWSATCRKASSRWTGKWPDGSGNPASRCWWPPTRRTPQALRPRQTNSLNWVSTGFFPSARFTTGAFPR